MSCDSITGNEYEMTLEGENCDVTLAGEDAEVCVVDQYWVDFDGVLIEDFDAIILTV